MKKHFLAAWIGLGICSSLAAEPVRLITGTVDPAGRYEMKENTEGNSGKIFRIIQVSHFLNTAEMERLLASGIEIQQYVPEKSYFAWVPEGFNVSTLRSLNISGMIKLAAELKIHPSFKELPYPSWMIFGDKIEVKISLERKESVSTYVSQLNQAGFEVNRTYDFSNLAYVRLASKDLTRLANLEFVTFVEPTDGPVFTENQVGRSNHRSNTMSTEYISNRRYNGNGVNVAIGDDGVIGPHIDYQGRMVNRATATNSTINHAGHCAGTMMGAGNLNQSTRGMGWGLKIHVYDYYGALTAAPNTYTADSMRVNSFSLGETCNAGYTGNAVTADRQMRQLPLMMHVFSAGNSGGTNCNWGAGNAWGQITGGYKMGKNVFTVGNLDYLDVIAPSSSRGPASDGRLKPEITAVGTDVNSTLRNNQYQLMTGTSMACPAIAGIFGQMIHAHRVLNNNQEPEAALIKAAMMVGADDLGTKGPDYNYGYGRVNGNNAVRVLEERTYFSDTVTQNGDASFNITVPAGCANAKVMVYYTDNEAAAGASRALINDLTLSLTDANNTTYLPWALLKSGRTAASVSAPAIKGVDSLNNHEMVEIDTPTAGNYTIRIAGTAVPQGPVKFYVVYQFKLADQILLTYPMGGESFVPGTTETIRWDDVPNNTSPYTLEYSLNGGVSWSTLSNAIAANRRYYNWSIPANLNSGNMTMRISRVGASDVCNAPMALYPLPSNLQVVRLCADSMEISWNGVTGATSYEVSLLGSRYMDSVGTTTGGVTRLAFAGTFSGTQEYWYSVRAVSTLAKGRRANAIRKAPGFINCTLATDMGVTKVVSPASGSVPMCSGSFTDSVRIWVKNFSNQPKNNIPVHYRVNNGTIITETLTTTIPVLDSALHTFRTSISQSTAGTLRVASWATLSGDLNRFNDTGYVTLNLIGGTPQTIGNLYNFDSGTRAPGTTNCEATSSVLPGGYINEANNTVDNIDWRLFGGATASATTGPDFDHTTGTATGNYVYLEASACFSKTAIMLTPCFSIPTGGIHALRFWYHMFGSSMGELRVDIFSNGQWTNDIMPVIRGDQGNAWRSRDISLAAYAGQNVLFRFRGTTGTNFYSDMALDDIGVVQTSGVGAINVSSDLVSIYPNPAKDEIMIQGTTNQINYQLVDISGKICLKGATSNSKIDVKSIPNGIYFIEIQTIEGSFRKKLIIQRN